MKLIKPISFLVGASLVLSPLMASAQLSDAVLQGLGQIPAIQQTINTGNRAIDAIPTVPTSNPKLEAKETGVKVLGFSLPFSWNQLAIGVGKIVVNQVVNSTVNWMNGGFNGSPSYVTDPKSYFGNLGNSIAGDYLNQIAPGICSAYSAKIVLALKDPRNFGDTSDYRPQCTLTQIGANLQTFNTDFNQGGGWKTWFALTQEDQNNPYQVYVDAQGALNNQVTNRINEELTKLNWGSGFKSVQSCEKYNGIPSGNIHLPGPTYDPNYGPGSCIKYGPIQTPGTTIKTHLDEALPANNYIKQIVTADQFDKILSALGNGLLQRFVFNKNGGVLSSDSSSSNGNGGGSGGSTPTDVSSQNVQCTPDQESGTMKDNEITWSVSSSIGGNSVTDFVWSGEGIDGAKGNSAKVIYDTAGVKTASVTASTTQMDDLGNLLPKTQRSKLVSCAKTVSISKYYPLQVSCSVGNNGAKTAKFGDRVVWSATVTGGSGVIDKSQWSGSQDVVPGSHHAIFPFGLGDETNDDQVIRLGNTTNVTHNYEGPGGRRDQSLEKVVASTDAKGNTKTDITLDRLYYRDGSGIMDVKASLSVVDKDPTVRALTNQECPTITIVN